MGIILKILIGIVLVVVAAVVLLLVAYVIIVARHEWRWRKLTTDEYRERHEQQEKR